MPRKPNRRCRTSNSQALTFSPFARCVASANKAKAKRQINDSKVFTKSSARSADRALQDNNEKSDSSDDEEFEGVIEAVFAFFDPKPDDFHGVKVLLQTYLDDKQWDLSGFVDLILEQTTVGSIVKIEEDEDDIVYGVITALNLGRYKDHKCIPEVKDFLLKVCPEKAVRKNLEALIGEQVQDVGLLVSQRVTNLPLQLLPPLYDALFDEITWAPEDEPTEELRNSFKFKYYLLITRIYKHKNADQKMQLSGSDEAVIYVKPEDEIFHKLSSWSFNFPMRTQPLETNELRGYRLMGLVMVVKADEVPTFRQQFKSMIGDES